MLQVIGENAQLAVCVGQDMVGWFTSSIKTRQCDSLSPITFITYQERVMDGLWDNGTGITIHGYQLNNLRFADDIDLIDERRDMLQANINTLNATGEEAGLRINISNSIIIIIINSIIITRPRVWK